MSFAYSSGWPANRDVHGYPDIRKNPDNELSGYILIINYPFKYLFIWRLILFMYVLCSFFKTFTLCYKNFVH